MFQSQHSLWVAPADTLHKRYIDIDSKPDRPGKIWRWGFKEAHERCCNLYFGLENASATFQLPEVPSFAINCLMLCFLGDKGSLPWKVTKQSSTGNFSCDKSCCEGPDGSRIQGKTATNWKSHTSTQDFKCARNKKISLNTVECNLKTAITALDTDRTRV